MLETFLSTFYLLFVIIDPLGIVPIFLAITARYDEATRKAIARRALGVATCLMLCFAIGGDMILDTLKISEPAFRIAGGLLLLLTAIDMVTAHHLGFQGISDTPGDNIEDIKNKSHSVAVFPLAIPLISGPGALISVVLAMRQVDEEWALKGMVLMALILILVLTYICLYQAKWLLHIIGKTGANVITRVFGIILASLAIQSILTAINHLMIHPIFSL